MIGHDATLADPSYAFALSRLDSYDFTHTPIGVFRSVERGSYDDAMAAQISTASARPPPTEMFGRLLNSRPVLVVVVTAPPESVIKSVTRRPLSGSSRIC